MKKLILCLYVFISSLIFPTFSDADYVIHLKHGGRFSTSQYWEKNSEIMFFNSGGVVGIEKNFVRKIEKLPADPYRNDYVVRPAPPPPAAKPAPVAMEEKQAAVTPEVEEKVDIQAYKDKMAKLKADINKTLTRIRKANTSKDLDAKNEATEDNRKISAEMWKLTEELEKKNNGMLPADWWEGVGREEPATP